MKSTIKTYFNWSSGKDAALALYLLKQQENINIDKLVTTVNEFYQRVSMHGVRLDLIERQSKEIGISLDFIKLPENPTMAEYEEILTSKITQYKSEGFYHCGFGDIFLDDLKQYREEQLKKVGVKAFFPLWKKNTGELLQQFIELGFKAILVCIDSSKLDKSFLGREIDECLINDLPKDVDLCGENGEFHTFCYDGPIFKHPVRFKKGEATFREYEVKNYDNNSQSLGFWFLDLIPI